MKVDNLIKELEKHKGKTVFVSLGMTFRDINGIDEEESESSIIYLVAEK